MKTIFVILCVVACSSAFGQSNKLQTAFDIYSKQVDPYLTKMVDSEFGVADLSREAIMAKHTRLAVLQAYPAIINKSVKEQVEKNNWTDIKMISKAISHEYKQTYTGLPKEFYDKAEEAVQKL